jgi:hypothetical protein
MKIIGQVLSDNIAGFLPGFILLIVPLLFILGLYELYTLLNTKNNKRF